MMSRLFPIVFMVMLLASACKEYAAPDHSNDPANGDTIAHETVSLYFESLELTNDILVDSLRNRYYSRVLQSLDQPYLKDTTNKNETLRLTVSAVYYYNDYCISLTRIDSLFRVEFKMTPDNIPYRATGLNNIELKYESDFGAMDTLYLELMASMHQLNVFQQNNVEPDAVRKSVGVDGYRYLLEYYANGKYVALERYHHFVKHYPKPEAFTAIVNKMHRLIPTGLIADIETARQPDDLKFPIFRKKKSER